MHILYADSHYEGAHRDWIDSYAAHSQHHITLLTMPGGDWRWRIQGGAVHLANQFLSKRDSLPPIDLILLNGMVSAPVFLTRTRPYLSDLPLAIYIQENQLNYPQEEYLWSNGAVVQVMSAYAADAVLFNGAYLKHDFLASLQKFLEERRDYAEDIYEHVEARADVLLRGINLKERFGDTIVSAPQKPITFLWNHRWAYEKGIEDFATALRQLHAKNIPFRVILAGNVLDKADLRESLLQELGERVILSGLLTGESYAEALRKADMMVACSKNEPLGVSMLEAIYMGCLPLMPAQGSFPVILPSEHHDLLYDGSIEQLISRMQQFALAPFTRPELVKIAAEYDWANVTAHYDEFLAGIAKKYVSKSQLR